MKNLSKSLLVASLVMICGSVFATANLDGIEKKILDKAKITQLNIAVEENNVFLRGQAIVLKDKMQAQKIAEKELGQDVTNNITLAPSPKTDEEIELDVAVRIRGRYGAVPGFSAIAVESKGGNVTLTGKVREAYLFERAAEEAMETPGVKSVQNKIEILPVSTLDDRLRVAIANRLYRRFPNYFLGVQPSIVILVEHSRVTLVGAVNSEVDRALAASIARGVFGVLSVSNELQVS